jgi:hypothetical protein
MVAADARFVPVLVLTRTERSKAPPIWGTDLGGRSFLHGLCDHLQSVFQTQPLTLLAHEDDVAAICSTLETRDPQSLRIISTPYADPLRRLAAFLDFERAATAIAFLSEDVFLLPASVLSALTAAAPSAAPFLTYATPFRRAAVFCASRDVALKGAVFPRASPRSVRQALVSAAYSLGAAVRPVAVSRVLEVEEADMPGLFKTDQDVRPEHLYAVDGCDGSERVAALIQMERREMRELVGDGRADPCLAPGDRRRGVVVVSTSTVIAGCHRAWVELAPYLAASKEFRFTFLLGRPGALSERLAASGATVVSGRAGLAPDDPHDAQLMFSMMNSPQVEIVHFDGSDNGAWPWAAKAAGKHVVQHVRVLDPSAYRSSLLVADLVLSVSKPVLEAVSAVSGWNGHSRLLPDGIDLAYWKAGAGATAPPVSPARGEAVAKQLFYPARISRLKRQHLALDVLAALVRAGENYHLVLCGDPDDDVGYYDQLKDHVASNSALLGSRVTWLPFTDDLRALYLDADYVLALSQVDALGMAILEALIMNKCVVAIDGGGVRDFEDLGGCLHLAGKDADAEGVAGLIRSLSTHTCRSIAADRLEAWSAAQRAAELCDYYSTWPASNGSSL